MEEIMEDGERSRRFRKPSRVHGRLSRLIQPGLCTCENVPRCRLVLGMDKKSDEQINDTLKGIIEIYVVAGERQRGNAEARRNKTKKRRTESAPAKKLIKGKARQEDHESGISINSRFNFDRNEESIGVLARDYNNFNKSLCVQETLDVDRWLARVTSR